MLVPVFGGMPPLVDVGMSYVSELEISLTAEETAQIRDLIVRYLSRYISYPECVSRILPLTGTSQPIDRLEAILCTSPAPLPNSEFPGAIRDARAKTRPWRPCEDQRLLAGIHRFGSSDWRVIASFVGNGRTKAQCSQRWSRGLDPKICKEQWSKGEDDHLIELVALYGEKAWTRISSELGNRCDVQCRYRYKQLQKDPEFDANLARALRKENDEAGKVWKVQKIKPPGQIIPQMSFPMVDTGCYYPPMMFIPLPQPGVMYQPPMQVRAMAPPGTVPLPHLTGQISTQASAWDWTAQGGMSPSGSFFGISPVNSFRNDP
jgi:hypothetical protein